MYKCFLMFVLGCMTMAQDQTFAHRAEGTFEVQLAPQQEEGGDPLMGRMTLTKQFSGALEGTSTGQMLTAMTAVKGSAGYVAVEKVTGTLDGRSGSFILQHSAYMNRGEPSMDLQIVPDSGTEGLTGITGTCLIKIEGGTHYYTLSYTLPE